MVNADKKGISKKTLCTILAGAMAVTVFAGLGGFAQTPVTAAATDYELAESIQEGTILHCFDWKYTDITAELENIAQAGFTAVQTSPAQQGAGKGQWYWLYQPLGFSVQTNELGSKMDLQNLCTEADKYGIKVIVDVVANHLAGDHENIQEDLVADEYWHPSEKKISYSDRYSVTHDRMGDYADLNSENEYVQQTVKKYAEELKGIGVDGIRWDAAKHIGLPSEDCDFWKVVTDTGLYNYGEILNAPVDGGGQEKIISLVKEYTDYMSITDNNCGGNVLSAFRGGRAATSVGNWAKHDVSASKLVYWGESHDTYSNTDEGNATTMVDQNLVDRAYAVMAAQNDATSLYLSRPFADDRELIMIGVKGSTHFRSAEVAAVNHFHNAMTGKASTYSVSDNCAVVTRKGGGAVIVCGKGSGSVSVDNTNGDVPAGTYKDEVTGNTFTVTADKITGTVGETGIAVVYNSSFLSRVSASVDSDTTFKTDTLSVVLTAQDVTDAKYTTSDGDSGSFKTGDTIEIGKNTDEGKITLTLTAKNSENKEIKAVYIYNKEAGRALPVLNGGGVVIDGTDVDWAKMNIYVYDEVTFGKSKTIKNAEWPGESMKDNGNGYYYYELPEKFSECKHIMIIFNNGAGSQLPGAMQDGLEMVYTDKMLYDDTKWIDISGEYDESSDESSEESSEEREYDPTKHTLTVMGSFNKWTSDIARLTDEDGDGVYTAVVTDLPAGEMQFKVRADGAWADSWGVYEPGYDRTFNSQTNCSATAEYPCNLVVTLDTTGDDYNLWPVGGYPIQSGSGDSKFDPNEHTFGVTGSFNGWESDVEMTKAAPGVFVANIGNQPKGTEFKVRADAAWSYSWGAYDEKLDITQNSQKNIKLDADAKNVVVVINTNTDDYKTWSVSYSYSDENNNRVSVDTGKPFVPEDPVVMGDVNGDGSADIADSLYIARADAGLATLSVDQTKAADVNRDGSADIADALMIARFDAQLIPNL